MKPVLSIAVLLTLASVTHAQDTLPLSPATNFKSLVAMTRPIDPGESFGNCWGFNSDWANGAPATIRTVCRDWSSMFTGVPPYTVCQAVLETGRVTCPSLPLPLPPTDLQITVQ